MKINTKNYENIIESVLIDDRETARIDDAMGAYSPFNPLKCHLDYGDYIFIGYNGIRVTWEFKTGNDFINSIIANEHLHNQVYNMITNEDYTFVIVQSPDLLQELDEYYFSSGISVNLQQVNGAIAEYCTVSNVLQVQTLYQAFDLMMRTSGKLIQQKPYRYNFTKKTTNSALNYLTSIKGLDDKAIDICRTLNLKCKDDLDNLTIEKLTTVKGIGEKSAKKILIELHGKDYLEKQTIHENRKTTKKIQ